MQARQDDYAHRTLIYPVQDKVGRRKEDWNDTFQMQTNHPATHDK